ncbi:ROK family protein [Fulvivirga sediminis]|uniref:ROK family protein n=1 Tax=Fulvivirga sediminis TaxID=2803949 RepID=A0A937F433_9BACT|nr:ROK family protein [Fulvivirga sediminis]MBL3655986.1 ROK family protein [Fulvivirga sediminis]
MNAVIVGIDIGGTNTKYGIVSDSGEVLYQNKIPTQEHSDFNDFVIRLTDAIKNGLEQLPGDNQILAVGIGAPNGNVYRGTIEHAPNLPWKGIVPLVDRVKEILKVPVMVTNDANAAAMGEMIYGGAKDMNDFIVITLGTGLGSGIVCNGDLVYGYDGFAAELGHVTINPNGRHCGCGRKGCLETYVSATGIKRTVYKLLADFMEDSELRGISFDDLSTKMITESAHRGDIVAKAAYEYTGKILGSKLADTVAHTNPEAIFLFGGLSLAGDLIFEPTIRHMEANLMPIYKGKVKILPSQLQNQSAPILGASSLVSKYLTKKPSIKA